MPGILSQEAYIERMPLWSSSILKNLQKLSVLIVIV